MFRNYLKVAIRNLFRHRGHSLLNIFGLSAGLACGIIILLFVQDELSYDQYHEHADRVFRLATRFNSNESIDPSATASPRLGPLLQQKMEGVETVCRLRPLPKLKMNFGAISDYEDGLLWADSTVFDIFSFNMLYGNPAKCLANPNSIVLTESLARKYFGSSNPVGKTLMTSNRYLQEVTGVIEDLPTNTHHMFSGLVSYTTIARKALSDTIRFRPDLFLTVDYTFLMLREGYQPKDFEKDWDAFYAYYMEPVGAEINGVLTPLMEPLPATHMNPNGVVDHFTAGSMSYIYAFTVIGIFILLLAGINYVNMATARSSRRTQEVAIRKVLGSRKRDLIIQFLGESFLTSLIALMLALGMVEMVLSLTPFNELMQKNLRLDLFGNPALLRGIAAMTLLLGALSGLYPAFFMSSILPAGTLRQRQGQGASLTLRRVLVVFQFTISLTVIVCTSLMHNQVDFMRNHDLGYQADNICVLAVRDSSTRNRLPQLRKKIEAHPGVISTTTAFNVPAVNIPRVLFRVEKEEEMVEEVLDGMWVGYDFLEGMDLEMVEGRMFKPDNCEDSTGAYLVNETAARQLFGGDAIGKRIERGIQKGIGTRKRNGVVVGVVEDFNVSSLHSELRPLILSPQNIAGGWLYIRMKGSQMATGMSYVEEIWQPSEALGSPFNPIFLDEQFAQLYDADQRQSSLMGILSFICVVISILGLLGFASYTIEQRRREIGIRKVLGATTGRIVLRLWRDVVVLILLASVMASVISYVLIKWWLTGYAYQTEIPLRTFLISGGLALILALSTIGIQTLRAALSNPALALKYE